MRLIFRSKVLYEIFDFFLFLYPYPIGTTFESIENLFSYIYMNRYYYIPIPPRYLSRKIPKWIPNWRVSMSLFMRIACHEICLMFCQIHCFFIECCFYIFIIWLKYISYHPKSISLHSNTRTMLYLRSEPYKILHLKARQRPWPGSHTLLVDSHNDFN